MGSLKIFFWGGGVSLTPQVGEKGPLHSKKAEQRNPTAIMNPHGKPTLQVSLSILGSFLSFLEQVWDNCREHNGSKRKRPSSRIFDTELRKCPKEKQLHNLILNWDGTVGNRTQAFCLSSKGEIREGFTQSSQACNSNRAAFCFARIQTSTFLPAPQHIPKVGKWLIAPCGIEDSKASFKVIGEN